MNGCDSIDLWYHLVENVSINQILYLRNEKKNRLESVLLLANKSDLNEKREVYI